MKVLLVWEEVPETTKLYVLEGELAELAIKSAGVFINIDDTEGHPIEELAEVLPTLKHHEITEPLNGPFDTVVVCGFWM